MEEQTTTRAPEAADLIPRVAALAVVNMGSQTDAIWRIPAAEPADVAALRGEVAEIAKVLDADAEETALDAARRLVEQQGHREKAAGALEQSTRAALCDVLDKIAPADSAPVDRTRGSIHLLVDLRFAADRVVAALAAEKARATGLDKECTAAALTLAEVRHERDAEKARAEAAEKDAEEQEIAGQRREPRGGVMETEEKTTAQRFAERLREWAAELRKEVAALGPQTPAGHRIDVRGMHGLAMLCTTVAGIFERPGERDMIVAASLARDAAWREDLLALAAEERRREDRSGGEAAAFYQGKAVAFEAAAGMGENNA